MIFIDKLIELDKTLEPEFDRLFKLALKNQPHSGDMLLWYCNGFFDRSILDYNKSSPPERLSPHLIGPGLEGLSERTHYSFIDKYRKTNICELEFTEYLKLHEWSPERSEEINSIVETEETTIQLEMLIYLKIWEADLIIKKLYELIRIINGMNYDWYFEFGKRNRSRLINNEIRDKLKSISPILYNLINDGYNTQIRNAIAHSNYSFHGRSIHLLNFEDKKPSMMRALSFDKWIDVFHNTIALHNHYIRLNNMANEHYANLALKHNNEVQILITEKGGKQYSSILLYREDWKDWGYKNHK